MEPSLDLAIIGGGPAGYQAAIRAAQLGLSAALIENRELGGTCLNRGCIPTKAILHASELYREAQDFGESGLSATGLSFDYGAVTRRKNQVVSRLRQGTEQLIRANRIRLIRGAGQIADAHTVRVTSGGETSQIRAEHLLVATGSVPAKPPIPGSNLKDVATSDEMLSEAAPFYRRLLIIGGGVIGSEFAAAFSSFGCEVTIVEAKSRILPSMGRELSLSLAMILRKRGVKIHTSATVERVEAANPLRCTFAEKGVSQSVEADGILIATGRRPNTGELFLPGCTARMENGYLTVDGHFETSLPGVYAVGDAIRGTPLAHAASAEGIAAVETIAGTKPTVHLEAIPACVYTSPEIASVGLTADEAKARGIAVKIGKALPRPTRGR